MNSLFSIKYKNFFLKIKVLGIKLDLSAYSIAFFVRSILRKYNYIAIYRILKEKNDNVVVIDVSLPSQGAEWISDSTIHTVNYLTKLGVLPKNIYCFIEWSQWSRITIPPYKFIDYKKHLNFLDKRNFNIGILGERRQNDYLVKALKGLDITSCEKVHNIGKIGDRVYITPTHSGFDSIGNPPELVSYLERAQEVERSIS